jgi:hypothetical protein
MSTETVKISPEQWQKVKCSNDEVKFVKLDNGTYLRSDGDHGFTDGELIGPDLIASAFECLPSMDMDIDVITVKLKPRKESA